MEVVNCCAIPFSFCLSDIEKSVFRGRAEKKGNFIFGYISRWRKHIACMVYLVNFRN